MPKTDYEELSAIGGRTVLFVVTSLARGISSRAGAAFGQRIKSSASIVFGNFLLRGVSALAKFVLTIYLARKLSVGALGLYSVFVIYIDYGRLLIGLAFYVYLMREMSRFPRSEWPRLFGQQLWFHFVVGMVVLPLSSLVFFFGLLPMNLMIPYLLLLPVQLLNVQIENYLVGASKSNIASLLVFLRTGSWIYLLVAAQWLLNIRVTLVVLLGVLILAEVMTLLIAFVFLKQFSLFVWKRFPADYDWIKKGFRTGFRYFAISILSIGTLTSSRLILKGFYGEEAVGIVQFYYTICSVATTLTQGSLWSVYLPRLLQLAADQQIQMLKRRLLQLAFLSLVSSALMLGGSALAIPIVLSFVGRVELVNHMSIFPILALGALLSNVNQVFQNYLYATEQDRILLMAAGLSTVTSIVLGFVLIPAYGVWGTVFTLLGASGMLLISNLLPSWRLWHVS